MMENPRAAAKRRTAIIELLRKEPNYSVSLLAKLLCLRQVCRVVGRFVVGAGEGNQRVGRVRHIELVFRLGERCPLAARGKDDKREDKKEYCFHYGCFCAANVINICIAYCTLSSYFSL